MLSGKLSLIGRRSCALGLAALLAAAPMPALALDEDIQCVPYARQLSGIQIYGDALTWWGQAAGKYKRGNTPQVGSVLAFRPHGNMRLGHVATVSRIVDARTLLVSHSNWSTIHGTRGHVENNVKVVDVSPAGDWSEVRVWYTPNHALGGTHWPTYGFIYPGDAPHGGAVMVAAAKPQPTRGPSRNLLSQIGGDWVEKAAAREQQPARIAPPVAPPVARPAAEVVARPAPRAAATVARASALPVGYTPSAYPRGSTNGPSSVAELLKRY